MPKDVRKDGEWVVYDLNANAPDPKEPDRVLPRIHASRVGVNWALRHNEACYMPEADARVFLKDPAFKVLNADDEEIPPLSITQQKRNLPTELAPNLVIANLAEINTDALLTRVAQMRGGQRFNSSSPRDKIIAFMIEQHMAASQKSTKTDGIEADGEVGDIDDAEAARILAAAA